MLLYIAGKVSRESSFGKHHWRDEFVDQLAVLSGIRFDHLDPLKYETNMIDPQSIFEKDCWLINQVDCVVVYLSDDISVGGSQEMLIAKYLKKPLIGFAPYGGKFYKESKEFLGQVIHNYIDPFVYASCDKVCGNIEDLAKELTTINTINPKTISIIDDAVMKYESQQIELNKTDNSTK